MSRRNTILERGEQKWKLGEGKGEKEIGDREVNK